MSQDKKAPPRDAKKPPKAVSMTDAEPANPVAERKPGEQAKANNSVEAKDAFGAPRPDTEWTREAMESQMLTPGFNGSDDQVKKERAKDLKE